MDRIKLPKKYTIGCLSIKCIGESKDVSYDSPNGKNSWLGSKEHLRLLMQTKRRDEKTQNEKAAEHILDNFDLYFNYACQEKETAILIAMHHTCRAGLIDSFLLYGIDMVYVAQYKMTEELINKTLKAINTELSSYKKIVDSVISHDFLNELMVFKGHMENLISESKAIAQTLNSATEINIIENVQSKKASYTWLSNPDTELPELYQTELPELYQLLIANKLIHPDTTVEQLKAVFTAQPLQAIQPVKWHDDNASELLYFILELERSGLIERKILSTDPVSNEIKTLTNYVRLVTCFKKSNGSDFNKESFKSLKTGIEANLSDDKKGLINSLLFNF